MGLFDDLANAAVKGAGKLAGAAAKGAELSFRKAKIKKEVEELRLRAEGELAKHNAEYKKLIESERTKYLNAREHYIVSYMFAQVMLTGTLSDRNFEFLDRMPKEYRHGNEFKQNLEKVQDEYYHMLADMFRNKQAPAAGIIVGLKDLLYFDEIRDEVQQILASEPFLPNQQAAAASIFTECENVDIVMQKVRDYSILDVNPQLGIFTDGLAAYKQGNYKEAVTQWLYGSYTKRDFDHLKEALLHFALDEEQDGAAIALYDSFQKICIRLFGLSVVRTEGEKESVELYPSVDMLIAEVLRHAHAGTAEQYDDTLKDWLEACGSWIGSDQLSVLQNVFFHVSAFNQEAIVLEYMVKNNIARTSEQEQRLKFLKGGSSVGVGANVNAPMFSAINVRANSRELLYDHRFINWKASEIQQYFNNLTLTRKNQEFNMVIDEWQKDVSVSGIRWNNEDVMYLISSEISRNFGDAYEVSVTDAGAAVDDWVDVIPSIYIHAKDSSIRNSELSFLVVGEQITYATVHLTIMVLLAPTDFSNGIMTNETLCKKVIAVKEKHNPRIDTFISTFKNILIAQMENWINQFNNNQGIY